MKELFPFLVAFTSVGSFLILFGLLEGLFPRKLITWERRLYRKMRLISAGKLNHPPKRWIITSYFLFGWVCVFLGIAMLWQLPVRVSLCNIAGSDSGCDEPAMPADYTNTFPAQFKVKVDEVVEPLIETRKNIGVSVGIIRGGDTAVFGYGRANLNSGRRTNGATIYEIGSITKVFTTLLLADMAENGLVSFTDPVQKFLPPTIQMPECDDTEITLIDLATHTAGLPGGMDILSDLSKPKILWYGFRLIKNPYLLGYTPSEIYTFVSKLTLATKPGSRYKYSNLGMELLGHILAHSQNKTYEDMVIDRICKPLGMADTRVTLSSEQRSRLARGHREGLITVSSLCVFIPAANVNVHPTLGGAGALRSTVNDLLKFLSANMGLAPTALTPAMETIQVVRHNIDQRTAIAMGWHVENPDSPDDCLIHHNGMTHGYSSYLGFNEKHRAGVVVLSNSAADVTEAGICILKALMDEEEPL